MCLQPGRTALVMAGQHVVVKAHENIEVEASHGGVGIKAETQLGLLGGNGGTGGILLDCRNESVGFVSGIGTDQNHQGLTLLSRGAVTAIAPTIRLEGTSKRYHDPSEASRSAELDGGTIDIVAPRVFLSSPYSSMAFGDNLAIRVANTRTPAESANVLLDAESITLPRVFTQQVCQQAAPNDQHVQLAFDATATALLEANLRTTQQNGLSRSLFPNMGFTWATSAQYNTLTPQEFVLFEQPWQRVYKASGMPAASRWASNPVMAPLLAQEVLESDPTTVATRRSVLSWPGYETWTRTPQYRDQSVTTLDPITHQATTTTVKVFVPGPMVTLPLTQWWDPATDAYEPALQTKDGPEVGTAYALPASEGVPIDAGYVIRPSVPTPAST